MACWTTSGPVVAIYQECNGEAIGCVCAGDVAGVDGGQVD